MDGGVCVGFSRKQREYGERFGVGKKKSKKKSFFIFLRVLRSFMECWQLSKGCPCMRCQEERDVVLLLYFFHLTVGSDVPERERDFF